MGEGINVFNSSEEEALTCLDPQKRERRETFLDILCVVKANHRQCALSIRTTIPVLLILLFRNSR